MRHFTHFKVTPKICFNNFSDNGPSLLPCFIWMGFSLEPEFILNLFKTVRHYLIKLFIFFVGQVKLIRAKFTSVAISYERNMTTKIIEYVLVHCVCNVYIEPSINDVNIIGGWGRGV